MISGSFRRIARVSIVTLLVLAVGGFLFIWSGIYNVAASRGHWTIVEWLLSFTMSNSVELRASMIEVPDLDKPEMIVLGANHYRTGCAPCHGAPGLAASLVAQAMLPPPPPLTGITRKWKDDELFWIVKHGIKYTGMPAWPAQNRDDEVWTLIAFLKAMPAVTQSDYGDMSGVSDKASARSDIAREANTSCGGCHGGEGQAPRSALVPRLHGQKAEYLMASLEGFAKGNRHSGIMQAVATELSPEAMRAFAAYYSGLSPTALPGKDLTGMTEGQVLANEGALDAGIPPCASCHAGNTLPTYPTLFGQNATYLAKQLRLWKDGSRGKTGQSAIMAPIAERMTDKQIEEVSAFYASQPPVQASR